MVAVAIDLRPHALIADTYVVTRVTDGKTEAGGFFSYDEAEAWCVHMGYEVAR